jgi:hypothetical protein
VVWKTKINWSPTNRKPNYADLNASALDLRIWGGDQDPAEAS